MDLSIWQFLSARADTLMQRTAEHLMLTSVPTLAAAVLGLGIAILAHKVNFLRGPVMSFVGILQTVPSLALLVLLMTVMGQIGPGPALVALLLYALLPIVRNCLLGLDGTPANLVEAARGLGMTSAQELLMVRLPHAVPAIVAGLRTATVVGVGIATLSAFIGAGGLGEFINRGLALSSTRLILLGAIPSALLAVLADLSLALAEWGVRPVKVQSGAKLSLAAAFLNMRASRTAAAALPGLLCFFSIGFYFYSHPPVDRAKVVRIGSKHFTEQILLGELMAQLLEARTQLKVKRMFDLGGTSICHGALEKGEIDLYPEYTGTALGAILKIEDVRDPKVAFDLVDKEYSKRFQLRWLQPFGFDNSWAIIVNKKDARRYKWSKISDLGPRSSQLEMAMTAEFAERQDGYKGMCSTYGLKFGKLVDIDTNVAYKALAQRDVDVITGNATDGRIAAFNLLMLKDDKSYFPPYQAAPVVREAFLEEHPEVEEALSSLSDMIDNDEMRQLNLQVDEGHLLPEKVARKFLQEHNLL